MPKSHSSLRACVPAWLRAGFPVALFLVAAFFFGGQLGWWSDDYWHNQRDPISDAVSNLTIRRGFFLRPLFYIVVPAITTLTWHHDWIAHTVQALSHATVVVLLWRLLLSLGLARRAAAAAAMLFMVFPPQFEALYWFSALPTSLASGLMLVLMSLTVAFARGRGWWTLALMPPLALGLCSLNEQPAAGILALPLVAMAAAPGAKVRRGFIPPLVCGIAVVVYAGLVVIEAPAGSRGSGQNLVRFGDLGARIDYFATVLWRRMYMRNFARGALSLGWEQFRGAGVMGWVWGGVLVGSAAVWLWDWVRSAPRGEQDRGGQSHRRTVALFLIGPGVFIGGCIPILILANYDPDSRTRYWPCVGLAVLVATLGSAAGRISWPRVVRGITGLLLIAALVGSVVMLVGIQAAMRGRYEMDRAQAADLRRLVPDPSPYTFFVPMDIQTLAVQTGSPVLDRHFRSVWEFPWTTPSYIQRVYGREDVRCGYWRHWTPGVPVKGASGMGIHYEDTLGPRFPPLPDGSRLIPWERAVVFVVDRDGAVRIVTRVILETPGGVDVEVVVPQARGLGDLALRLPRLKAEP